VGELSPGEGLVAEVAVGEADAADVEDTRGAVGYRSAVVAEQPQVDPVDGLSDRDACAPDVRLRHTVEHHRDGRLGGTVHVDGMQAGAGFEDGGGQSWGERLARDDDHPAG
jgi:hypothetical protein